MDDKKAQFTPESSELKGKGVDFWKARRDVNAAEKSNEDRWRDRRHLANEVSDKLKSLDDENCG